MAKNKRNQVRWKGYTYEEKKAIQEKIARGRELFRLLHNRVTNSDSDTHMVYNELFELVESLYGELDMDGLVADSRRRWRDEKEKVRKAHG